MSYPIDEMVYQRFIAPTETERPGYIGIEIEMPVVNLSGEATEKAVSRRMFQTACEHFGFTPVKYDDDGVCCEAVSAGTGDNFSFDCSYNNFEISFGKVKTLHEAFARFQDYVSFIGRKLKTEGHTLTGMGIHPYYRQNLPNFVANGRYKMLEGYLKNHPEWNDSFHRYPAYPSFVSASQVQLDVNRENLLQVIRVFTLLEPIKALLFANSYLPDEPDYLCSRDMLWQRSPHGICPHNLGTYDPLPGSIDELVAYIAEGGMFCAERDGRYLYHYPLPLSEYFCQNIIEGEYFADGAYRPIRFVPEPGDIAYLRMYKFTDLTPRGTVEFRSSCTQPLSEAMTVAAFHLGLMNRLDEVEAILENDTVIYSHGLSSAQLRDLFNRRELPDFAEREPLSGLIGSVLKVACRGLLERGFGEEIYLAPLWERARTLCPPAKAMLRRLENGTDMTELIEQFGRTE